MGSGWDRDGWGVGWWGGGRWAGAGESRSVVMEARGDVVDEGVCSADGILGSW